jgi:prevent-host-death family protein
MSDMSESVTVRDLQKDLKRVLARVARGHVLQVTRRRHPVAVLSPPRLAHVEPWPDLDARARSVFGDRVIAPPPSEMIGAERGDR